MRSTAALSERVSFQSRASRITAPSLSSAIMPCCWPAIDIAEILCEPNSSRASDRAFHQCCGSISVPSGCGLEVDAISSPLSESLRTTFTDCVEESTPATIGIVSSKHRLGIPELTDRVLHSDSRAFLQLQHQNSLRQSLSSPHPLQQLAEAAH